MIYVACMHPWTMYPYGRVTCFASCACENISQDHNFRNIKEKERVVLAGGQWDQVLLSCDCVCVPVCVCVYIHTHTHTHRHTHTHTQDRLNSFLDISRAFGDVDLSPSDASQCRKHDGLSAEPDIMQITVCEGGEWRGGGGLM